MTQNVHHQTERGARIALAKKQISRASYEAVLAGTLTLARAKELGRDWGPHDTGQASGSHGEGRTGTGSVSAEDHTSAPPQPVLRISKNDTTQECWCGCQELTSPNRRWKAGHDQRGKGIIRRVVKEGKVANSRPSSGTTAGRGGWSR